MVIVLKHTLKTFKLVIMLFLFIFGSFSTTKDSYAVSPLFVGFIIESSQIEGTSKGISLSKGETLTERDRPMLELKLENVTAKDLKIKKLFQTQNGMTTTVITSNDSVFIKNLTLTVTNADFTGTFLPEHGNIGLNNVKLLAHLVTTNDLSMSNFSLSFIEGGTVEMEPKSEQELLHIKAVLESSLMPVGTLR